MISNFHMSQASYFARLHAMPGENWLNLCSGVGSDMLGPFMRGLHVWGVEADLKQCEAAAVRFDKFTQLEGREEIEELIPPAVAYDFIVVQSQLILDIVAAQRRSAKLFYDNAKFEAEDRGDEALPEAHEVYTPPSSQAVMRSIYEFNYSDQLKQAVEQHLLPNVPRGSQYDAALPVRLRSTYKAPSSSSSAGAKSVRRHVVQKVPEKPLVRECITCGEEITEDIAENCTGCGSSFHKDQQGEAPACFFVFEEMLWCTKKCYTHFNENVAGDAADAGKK